MWAISRRTGLFIVSYAPLAAMFMVSRWPRDWSHGEMFRALVLVTAVVILLLVPFAASILVGRWARIAGGFGVLAAIAVLIVGLLHNWGDPLLTDPRGPGTAATVSGIAWAFVVLAVLVVGLVIYNARRVGSVDWRVSDPRDQGGAVAGYLATYLLPLLSPAGSGWRVAVAYGIYLLTVYIIFIRSEGLVLINPTLYLFGYRVFDVEVAEADEGQTQRVLLVTNDRITGATDVSVLPLGDDCYLWRRPNE